ncbi:hypothetical protein [Serinicoccus hydrothermalis]|uniref:hypothetical protein n=1 Tax=Serinicoccus hydrothermalis TaxID=1758689 RepID=UPI0012FC2498|nr:hypothetical protein [Serinicoccus hydrothermalis]
MAIIQVPLDIPEEVLARVLTGEYVRDGGVIRDLGGRLVKLLDDADVGTGIEEAAARAGIDKWGGRSLTFAVGLGLVAVAAASGAAVWGSKRRRAAEVEDDLIGVPAPTSLTEYLDAAGEGTLNAVVIDALLADLDAAQDEDQANMPFSGFSSERLRALAGIVASYTNELIGANALELDRLPVAADTSVGSLDDLRRHLELQRRMFDNAAA